MCRGHFKLQCSTIAFSVGVNTNDETTCARDGIAVGGVGNIGVGNDPTVCLKLFHETDRDSAAIMIRVKECCKNR